MAAEVADEVELPVVALDEAPFAVDAREAVVIAAAGDDLQREVVGGLHHGEAGADPGGAAGFVDVEDGVGHQVARTRRAAGVDHQDAAPQAEQAVGVERAGGAGLDAGVAEEGGGVFQAAFVDGFRVAVEEVADRGGGGVHRALRVLRQSPVRGAEEEKNRAAAMSAAHPEEGGSETALRRSGAQALRRSGAQALRRLYV